jgi:C_GCAxxG_C_C family probable redox protein
MDKKQVALETHDKGFNCAQSVFAAVCGDVGVGREEALKISACFGGGMKCGEVCGAITGALMAIGMKYGSIKDCDLENKKLVGIKTLEYMNKFKEKYDSVLCRELLENSNKQTGSAHAICPKLITDAVELTEEMINNNSKSEIF